MDAMITGCEVLDLTLCDNDLAQLATGALAHESKGHEKTGPQQEEMHQRFATELFHPSFTLWLRPRCVPDGRRVRALLTEHGDFWRHRDPEILRIIGRPTR